jgi:hypothetical protein
MPINLPSFTHPFFKYKRFIDYINFRPVLSPMEVDPENQHKINKRAQRFQSSMENNNRSSPSILSTLNASVSI